MHKLVMVSVGVLASLPAVASAAPAWCGNARFGQYTTEQLSAQDANTALVALTMATCSPKADARSRAADIETARRDWGQRLGMTEPDWADMVELAQLRAADRSTLKWDLGSKHLAALTPLDQYKAIAERFHAPGSGDMADSMYIADALEPTLTEVGRLAVIEACIKPSSTAASNNAVPWAICEGDIERLDAGKLATELRGDTSHSGAARMMVRVRAYAVARALKAHADEVAKVIALDPAYKQMFAIAEQARTEWAQGVGKNTELLALATALDSATFFQSTSQLDGCEARTGDALRAAIGKLPAKAFAKMNDERNDPFKGFAATAGPVLGANPDVQLAAIPYIECQPTTGLAVFLSDAVSKFPGQRGPRSAALDKLMAAPVQLDDKNAKVGYPSISTRPYFLSHGSISSFGGVIKSIKPNGDSVTVEFEHTSFKQLDCTSEHKTNRIDRILSNGELMYQVICDRTAMVEHNNTIPPTEVDAKFARLLKPGTRISLTNDAARSGAPAASGALPRHTHRAGKPGHAVTELLAVWPNKTATAPTIVLGATLK